ncbi:phage/plasmid replication protein [uncultured Winogradskyella sp.]|uniref:phage/plasmid replication domain-containing protein n=1 Tax=uncultured Winogradskyella sp. TaxID=395353 RepID=UPI00261F075A|nr:phage/plasmid replication protein [uncultured Winogradskyella sp.]
MIDTIKGYIDLNSNTEVKHLIVLAKKSESEYGFNATFNIENIKLTLRLNREGKPLKLYFNGSLPKFYFGNNVSYLNKADTKSAITKLSDCLRINMSKSILTRVDCGFNINLKHPVHEYIDCLAYYPRLDYMRYKDSVTFFKKHARMKLLFYDKKNEIRNNSKELLHIHPDLYLNKNILRYEISLYRRLNTFFKVDKFTLNLLMKQSIEDRLLRTWSSSYFRVKKIQLGIDPKELLHNHNGLFKYLAYHGIDRLGFNKTINTISHLNFNVKNPRSKRSKMKKTIKVLFDDVNKNTLDNNLITELDYKVSQIKDYI